MIHRAKFQNFKALQNVQVTFDMPLTVLVGPNGCGKTSILEGIHYASQFAIGRTKEQIFTGGYRLDFYASSAARQSEGPRPDVLVETTFMEDKVGWNFRFRATQVPQDGEFKSSGDDGWRCSTQHNRVNEAEWVTHARKQDIPPPVRRLGSAQFLYLDAGRMSAPTYSDESPPRMRADGDFLPSVLAYLSLNQPDKFRELVQSIAQIVPTVRGIRFDRVPFHRLGTETQKVDGKDYVRDVPQRFMGEVLLYDFANAPGVQGTMVSEGTLFVTGLLTAMLSPTRPRLLLLDDLDKGLHPKAQGELIALMKRLLAAEKDLQIIATSHSPYILDKLQPDEVRVVALRDDGTAACAPLKDHPKYPMWKDSMSPGEFWTHAGEDWVKHLTPQAPNE